MIRAQYGDIGVWIVADTHRIGRPAVKKGQGDAVRRMDDVAVGHDQAVWSKDKSRAGAATRRFISDVDLDNGGAYLPHRVRDGARVRVKQIAIVRERR